MNVVFTAAEAGAGLADVAGALCSSSLRVRVAFSTHRKGPRSCTPVPGVGSAPLREAKVCIRCGAGVGDRYEKTKSG